MAKLILYDTRRKGVVEPTPEAFQAMEEYIRWCENEAPMKLRKGMADLVFHMALVNQGYARRMSWGPYDPQAQNASAAWRIPVRRITENYYLGWKVKELRPGTVQLYNDSREAYFIEYGINWLGAGHRVRRPILKLSLIKTLQFMSATQSYDRIWANIFKHDGKGYGFTQSVQAPGGGHTRWEDISDREYHSMMRNDTTKDHEFRFAGGVRQIRRRNLGSGRFSGPTLGRRLP